MRNDDVERRASICLKPDGDAYRNVMRAKRRAGLLVR